VKPSDLRNDLWCRKTRMLGLSDGERISMIHSAVLTQYTRVTDRRTDGRTDGRTELAWHKRAIAYMLSRVKTHENIGNSGRGSSQGLPKFFRAPICRAHCAVIFAIAQLSCPD